MFDITNTVFSRFWIELTNYLPNFFGGFVILTVGVVLAGLVKKVLLTIFSFFKFQTFLQKTNLLSKGEVKLWEEILAEVFKWTLIILFLIPTLEVWGLSRATQVLNQILFYLPNVIAAVVIGLVGLIAANLVSDLVKHSITTLGATSASTMAVFSKSAIIFFTMLVVMNQLGVAQDLIRILFTGIVAMLAIAGGLAFGLGGKDLARGLLEELRSKIK